MKLFAKIVGLGTFGLLLVALVLSLSALFWGWPIMVIAGACGWHIPYFWASVGLGALFSLVAG